MSILTSLSTSILLSEDALWKYISSAPHRYKKYKIPKRNGRGFRDIAQPSKELKFLQKSAINNIECLKELPVHIAAKAYIKNINIRDNAEVHRLNPYVLKMDFSNFFPSIRPLDFIEHIESKKKITLNERDKQVIAKLFFYSKYRNSKLVLSIGAPTSPYISNTLLYEFDNIIQNYCANNKISYTRYADDLFFSTSLKNILFNIPDFIKSVLSEIEFPSLLINEEKTVFLSKKENRHITGLIISNDGNISIGRKKKRFIRSLVYKYKNGDILEKDFFYLKGYLCFCLGVDKNFINTIERKYGKEVIYSIINNSSFQVTSL